MAGLVEVVHEHLSHLVDGDGGIDRTLEAQLPHQVRQSAQVHHIRMAQENSIYPVQVPMKGTRRGEWVLIKTLFINLYPDVDMG